MATYTGSATFSGGAYTLNVTVVTTPVAGGMELAVSSTATFLAPAGVTPAYSDAGTKGYSVPGGRTTSTSGTLTTSGSGVNWTYDFRTGNTQTVWSGFNRYVASGYGSSTTVGITAAGSGSSYLPSTTASVSVSLAIPYAINYNANGGTGTTSATTTSTTAASATLTVASNSYSRSGYVFTGWNTAADGSGTSYSPGNSLTLTSPTISVTLYAQWTTATPAPVWSNGIDAWTTLRVGYTLGDYLYASDSTSYSFVSGPAGLGVTDYGTYAYITGTISNTTTPVTVSMVVRATGPGGSTDNSRTGISLRAALPEWTDTSLADARVGTSYTSGNTFAATGATSWSISSAPSGLSYTGTTSTTVGLTGTPTTAGLYTIYATPYNRDGTTASDAGTQVGISLNVLPRIPVWSDETLSTSARVGVPYSDTVSANYAYSWGDGILPTAGLSFSGQSVPAGTATGTVSGTPTAYGDVTFTLTPYNSASESGGNRTFTISVLDGALSWATQTLDTLTVTEGGTYSDTGVAVTSGPVSVMYSVTPGYSLPDGITINATTGALETATTVTAAPGLYTFRLRATNGSGETIDTNVLSITVEALGGYVQVKTSSGWADATVYVKTAGGWAEGTVNAKSPSGWGPSFTA